MDSEIGKIPDDWELMTIDKIKANDKKAIISGPFGSNIGSRYFVESGIPVIRGNNLKADMTRFIDDGFVFLTLEKAIELNTWAERNDLIFTAAGTLGQVGIIPNNSKYEKYIISNKQLRLRVNERIIRPLFAFYWFSSPIMVSYIQQRNTGSTIPLINLSVLRSLPIPVPPLDIQDRVINIVDSLDSKIALNRSMNSTLEAIGQALFKHWFVDFEFPDGEGKPYRSSGGEMVETELGEVPKGWRVVKNISELCSLINYGYTQSSTEEKIGPKFLRVMDINKGDWIDWTSVPYCEIEDKNLPKYLLEKGDIVVARMADPGKLAIFESDIAAVFASYLIRIRLNNPNYSYYLYYLMKSIYYQEYILGAATGSVQKNLNAKGLTNGLPIIISADDTINRFNKIIGSLRKKLNENVTESINLSQIRDALLPKLMSGEIKVR